jgi:hypothetical protein
MARRGANGLAINCVSLSSWVFSAIWVNSIDDVCTAAAARAKEADANKPVELCQHKDQSFRMVPLSGVGFSLKADKNVLSVSVLQITVHRNAEPDFFAIACATGIS